jgi:hypothetical protein
MAIRAAVLELRHRVLTLQSRLEVLAERVTLAGGPTAHSVVNQVDTAALDALGWVKAMRRAIRSAGRAATPALERKALAEARQAAGQLKRKEPGKIHRVLMADLAELGKTGTKAKKADAKLMPWATETIPVVRAAAEALRAVDAAMAACLAADGDRRVVVKTVTVVE